MSRKNHVLYCNLTRKEKEMLTAKAIELRRTKLTLRRVRIELRRFAVENGVPIGEDIAKNFIGCMNVVKASSADRDSKEAVRADANLVSRRDFSRLSRSAAIVSGRLWVYQQVENFFHRSPVINTFESQATYG